MDCNGAVVPCCNFRSDVPAHAEYVLGDLNGGQTLLSIYASEFAARFRASLLNEDVKGGLCRNCHFALQPASDESRARMAALHSVATANVAA